MGLALSGGLRLGNRHRRTRAILVPFGLNLAALGFLAAVLASGSELGLLPGRWLSWLVPAGACAVAGLLVFRFPRSVGLPVLALVAVLTWYSTEALADFAVLDPLKTSLSLQPLTDREVVTAFTWRADFLSSPAGWPFPPVELYRLRQGNAQPGEWWWGLAAASGWGKSSGAVPPLNPMKFGLYRLALKGEKPVWTLFKPELTPPQP